MYIIVDKTLRLVRIGKKKVQEAIKQVQANADKYDNDKARRFQCYKIFAEMKRRQVRGERVRWSDAVYDQVDRVFGSDL